MHHNYERDLARLEAAQRQAETRMALQQERMNLRFAQIRQKISDKHENTTSVSQQKIIEAALELLSEEGLNNLSLRKLAAKLDMKAPALYWHFSNKEVLIDYMADAILRKEFPTFDPVDPSVTWQGWLSDQMLSLRRSMLAYPDGGRVVAGAHLRPAVTLGNLFESVLGMLTQAGFSIRQARQILMTTTTYTFGFVIEEQAGPNNSEQIMHGEDTIADTFPLIFESMKDARTENRDMKQEFLTGLTYVIQGATSMESKQNSNK
jgi:TetR/AcrR family tetracycline transcriptional repressor